MVQHAKLLFIQAIMQGFIHLHHSTFVSLAQPSLSLPYQNQICLLALLSEEREVMDCDDVNVQQKNNEDTVLYRGHQQKYVWSRFIQVIAEAVDQVLQFYVLVESQVRLSEFDCMVMRV